MKMITNCTGEFTYFLVNVFIIRKKTFKNC